MIGVGPRTSQFIAAFGGSGSSGGSDPILYGLDFSTLENSMTFATAGFL